MATNVKHDCALVKAVAEPLIKRWGGKFSWPPRELPIKEIRFTEEQKRKTGVRDGERLSVLDEFCMPTPEATAKLPIILQQLQQRYSLAVLCFFELLSRGFVIPAPDFIEDAAMNTHIISMDPYPFVFFCVSPPADPDILAEFGFAVDDQDASSSSMSSGARLDICKKLPFEWIWDTQLQGYVALPDIYWYRGLDDTRLRPTGELLHEALSVHHTQKQLEFANMCLGPDGKYVRAALLHTTAPKLPVLGVLEPVAETPKKRKMAIFANTSEPDNRSSEPTDFDTLTVRELLTNLADQQLLQQQASMPPPQSLTANVTKRRSAGEYEKTLGMSTLYRMTVFHMANDRGLLLVLDMLDFLRAPSRNKFVALKIRLAHAGHSTMLAQIDDDELLLRSPHLAVKATPCIAANNEYAARRFYVHHVLHYSPQFFVAYLFALWTDLPAPPASVAAFFCDHDAVVDLNRFSQLRMEAACANPLCINPLHSLDANRSAYMSLEEACMQVFVPASGRLRNATKHLLVKLKKANLVFFGKTKDLASAAPTTSNSDLFHITMKASAQAVVVNSRDSVLEHVEIDSTYVSFEQAERSDKNVTPRLPPPPTPTATPVAALPATAVLVPAEQPVVQIAKPVAYVSNGASNPGVLEIANVFCGEAGVTLEDVRARIPRLWNIDNHSLAAIRRIFPLPTRLDSKAHVIDPKTMCMLHDTWPPSNRGAKPKIHYITYQKMDYHVLKVLLMLLYPDSELGRSLVTPPNVTLTKAINVSPPLHENFGLFCAKHSTECCINPMHRPLQ